MSAEYRRSLPFPPNFEQQQKLAKELLEAFRRDDADAQSRVRSVLPDKSAIVLADAQLVLAREYGFANWVELKRHIEAQIERAEAPIEQARKALQAGDARTLRRLLERHAELRALINEPIFSFDSPALVHFAGSDNLALIDVLLEFGADPNRKSSWAMGGFHPLHSATSRVADRLIAAGSVPDACAAAHLDRPELLARLIAEDPTCVHQRGGDGQTPLHFARSRVVVDLLLEAGADPDARDVDHHATPAQWMLDHRRGRGRYELAAYLVERGATADIFLAAALGLTDRVRALLNADPGQLELRTTQGEYAEQLPASYHIYMWTIGADLSPLQVAEQFEQPATLALMRSIASPKQRLMAALAQGDARETQALLRAQPDLLSELTPEDRRILPEAAWSANAPAVELMLSLGFDPLTPNQNGATALHCAAWEGSAECVRTILRYGEPETLLEIREPEHHSTPLRWCCHGSCYGPKRGEHAEVARLLLNAGAVPMKDLGDDVSKEVRAVIEAWPERR